MASVAALVASWEAGGEDQAKDLVVRAAQDPSLTLASEVVSDICRVVVQGDLRPAQAVAVFGSDSLAGDESALERVQAIVVDALWYLNAEADAAIDERKTRLVELVRELVSTESVPTAMLKEGLEPELMQAAGIIPSAEIFKRREVCRGGGGGG